MSTPLSSKLAQTVAWRTFEEMEARHFEARFAATRRRHSLAALPAHPQVGMSLSVHSASAPVSPIARIVEPATVTAKKGRKELGLTASFSVGEIHTAEFVIKVG